MKARAARKIQERLVALVRSRYELITPEPEQGLFNFRCFDNAVEYARRFPGMDVVEVIYIDAGEPILHYVNHDHTTDRYLETTLGWRAKHLEYYRVRRIHPNDHAHIHAEFDRALNSWWMERTNWWHRNVLGIRRVL